MALKVGWAELSDHKSYHFIDKMTSKGGLIVTGW